MVEFAHMAMGPTCGLVLADLGAEVIEVEPPGGEHTDAVLRSIGCDGARIAALRARGAIA